MTKLAALAIPFHLAIAYADLTFLQNLTAANVYALLKAFGVDVNLNGAVLRFDGFDVLVSRDSTGWKSAFFLAALIAATRAKRSEKLVGAFVMIPAVYAINIVRVSVTAYSAFYGYETFVLFHDMLWQLGMVVAVLTLWFIWLRGREKMLRLAEAVYRRQYRL